MWLAVVVWDASERAREGEEGGSRGSILEGDIS